MESVNEGKGNQVVPQSHLACTCAGRIHEREWVFKKLRVMNSSTDLAMIVKKMEEELKRREGTAASSS
jgi:hypothetical protein